MLLLLSGLLYLVGVSIILILKPTLMFTKEGEWKEFGLGRNKHKYTWMPFWLFAISWAIMSYIIVLVIASSTGLGGVSQRNNIPIQNDLIEPDNISIKAMRPSPEFRKKPTSTDSMKSGYYILDTNETTRQGIPKYVYLGPEAPDIVFQDS